MNPYFSPGRKTAKTIPPYLTIPHSEPYNAIFPDTSQSLAPTLPTPKLISQEPVQFISRPIVHEAPREIVVKSPPRYEFEKKSVSPQLQPRFEADNDELERLRREVARLRSEVQRLDDDRHHLLDEIGNLRAAKLGLEHQLEDYNRLLREREEMNRIIDGLKHHIMELEASHRGPSGLHSDLEKMRMLLIQKDNELMRWGQEHDRLILELNQHKNRGQDDMALVLFMIEIERLHSLLSDRGQEIEHLVNSHHMEVTQLDMEIMRLRSRLAESENRVDIGEAARLKSLLMEKDIQHVLVMIETERLSNIMIELQNENDMLIHKINEGNMNERVRMLEVELQQWRLKYSQLEKDSEAQWKLRFNQISNEKTGLESKVMQLTTELNKINDLCRHLKEDYDHSQMKIQELTIELNRMRERPDMQNQMMLLRTEVERLHHEVEMWQQKYSILETAKFEEVQMIISQNADLARKLSMTAGDSEKILRLFKELESEHSMLRSKYHTIAEELEHMNEARHNVVASVQESPKKAVITQSVMTKIHSIGSENTGYRSTLSPQTVYGTQKYSPNEMRYSNMSGGDAYHYH